MRLDENLKHIIITYIICLFVCVVILIIDNNNKYNEKITKIIRHEYIIKLQNGKCQIISKDEKEFMENE